MRYLAINLKQYLKPLQRREELLEAIKQLNEEAEQKGVVLVVLPQFLECNFFAWHGVNTFVQHVNGSSPGKGTGSVLPDSLPINGVKGALLNHSECRLKLTEIKDAIKRLNSLGVYSMVCAKNGVEAGKLAKMNPDLVAVEPPKLIEGDVSVSKAKPSLIKNCVSKVKNSNSDTALLVGAGVKKREDVEVALNLGASGVLVASGVAKADSFYEAIKELLDGF